MTRVVFIAGLGHSGSTLLDLMLNSHDDCVGVGEAVRSLRPGERGLTRTRTLPCACGRPFTECEFWSVVSERLDGRTELSVPERYRIVLDSFRSVFGENRIMIDSGKHLELLEALHHEPDVDLKVIHLVRDVRAFTVSKIDAGRRKGYGLADRSATVNFCRWHHRNVHIERFTQREKIPTCRVSYESLCLTTDAVVDELCRFIGLTPQPGMLTPDGVGHHGIRGNRRAIQRVRDDANGQKIVYDGRWFHRTEWAIPSLLLRHVMHYNRDVSSRKAA